MFSHVHDKDVTIYATAAAAVTQSAALLFDQAAHEFEHMKTSNQLYDSTQDTEEETLVPKELSNLQSTRKAFIIFSDLCRMIGGIGMQKWITISGIGIPKQENTDPNPIPNSKFSVSHAARGLFGLSAMKGLNDLKDVFAAKQDEDYLIGFIMEVIDSVLSNPKFNVFFTLHSFEKQLKYVLVPNLYILLNHRSHNFPRYTINTSQHKNLQQ